MSLYNEESEEKTSYYKVRDVVNTEKQFILQGDTPDDDCRCETCENSQLLLHAIKSYLKQIQKGLLAEELPDNPMDVVELGFCSIKNIL